MTNFSTKTKVTTQVTKELELTGDDIRELLGVSGKVEVFFDVPGGGDWSNTRIDIDKQYTIGVRYTEVTETED